MRYVFDLDNTLCRTVETDYAGAVPVIENIARLNALYDQGNHITIYTARGTMTGIDWGGLTKEQLDYWGVKYHDMILGKPYGDAYIDDKAHRPDEKWPGEQITYPQFRS